MQEFKISFKERLARDDTNIRSLVQECDQRFGESSPIKLFKPQNVDGVAGMEGANSEDFILIIMSPAQKQVQYCFFIKEKLRMNNHVQFWLR